MMKTREKDTSGSGERIKIHLPGVSGSCAGVIHEVLSTFVRALDDLFSSSSSSYSSSTISCTTSSYSLSDQPIPTDVYTLSLKNPSAQKYD